MLAGAEERRSAANKDRDNIDGTVKTLYASLPKEAKEPVLTDHALEADELQKALSRKEASVDGQAKEIQNRFDLWKTDREKRLAAEIQAATNKLKEAADLEIATMQTERDTEISDMRAKSHDELQAMRETLGGLKAKATTQVEMRTLRKHHDEQRAAWQAASQKAARAQEVVDALVKYRAECVANSNLPDQIGYKKGGIITFTEPGGEVKDFDSQLNRSRKIKVLVRLATFVKQPLHLFVIDDLEALGEGSMEWLKAECREHDYQAIFAVRSEGPLRIEYSD